MVYINYIIALYQTGGVGMAKGQISPENTTMSFVIPKVLKAELGILATKENRSMGNLICTLVDNYVQLNKRQELLTEYYKLISETNKSDT